MSYLYFLYIIVGVILGMLLFGPLLGITLGFIGFLGAAIQLNRKKIEELEKEIDKLKTVNN